MTKSELEDALADFVYEDCNVSPNTKEFDKKLKKLMSIVERYRLSEREIYKAEQRLMNDIEKGFFI